jgi:hypothetical protein
MKAKVHPTERPRGVRDSAAPSCMKQAGGKLVWIENGQPMFWSDRPFKFPGHLKARLAGWERRSADVVMEDIKWKQLGGKVWWRLPAWPDGIAHTWPPRPVGGCVAVDHDEVDCTHLPPAERCPRCTTQ